MVAISDESAVLGSRHELAFANGDRVVNKNIAEFDQASQEVRAAAELQPIALRSLFWRPNWLEPSDWMEHIPFAFWLVEAHRPKIVVELGTRLGTSYFAFCSWARLKEASTMPPGLPLPKRMALGPLETLTRSIL